MHSRSIYFYVLCFMFLFYSLHSADNLPLLQDLIKPTTPPSSDVTSKQSTPLLIPSSKSNSPRLLANHELISDAPSIMPTDALFYISIPDFQRAATNWKSIPVHQLVNQPQFQTFMNNNSFDLTQLFSDLPEAFISLSKVKAISASGVLAQLVFPYSKSMYLASYIGNNNNLEYLLLVDVGADRTSAYELLETWSTSFTVDNTDMTYIPSSHNDDYVDVWEKASLNEEPPFRFATGFIKNFLVISTDLELYNKAFYLSQSLDDPSSLKHSIWLKRIAASHEQVKDADCVSYLCITKLSKVLKNIPYVNEVLDFWSDIYGHSVSDNDALYYSLRFKDSESIETLLCQVNDSQSGNSRSLPAILDNNMLDNRNWRMVSLIPYQPSPNYLFMFNLRNEVLNNWIQAGSFFGTSKTAKEVKFPDIVKTLINRNTSSNLTGELGYVKFFSSAETDDWLIILGLDSDISSSIPKGRSTFEKSGLSINSDDSEWQTNNSWSVITSSYFRNLNGNFLLIASTGNLLSSVIDQLLINSNFLENKDFMSCIAKSGDEQSVLFYFNTTEFILRNYYNFAQYYRQIFPRSSGLNSRPSLNILRKYSSGIMYTLSQDYSQNEFLKLTAQSPVPTALLISTEIIANIPKAIRSYGRLAMLKSIENLQQLWLNLQLYASSRGHFPSTKEDLINFLKQTVRSDTEITNLFINPAAAEILGRDKAFTDSYTYVEGLTTNDDTDVPILYESHPWNEEFSNIIKFFPDLSKATESGEFKAYRILVQIDGKVKLVTETDFKEKYLPLLESE